MSAWPHIYTFDTEQLDLGRTVSSGQTFRWERRAEGWAGVDGQHAFLVVGSRVHSNAPEVAFRRLFGLDEDLEAAWTRIVAAEPRLAAVKPRMCGFRIIGSSSPVETLFSFLCTANNHLARIGPMVRALAAYGEALPECPDPTLRAFPSAERLATVAPAELRMKGFGYRAESIPRVAHELVARGKGWLEALADVGLDGARRELMRLPSVGPKLADCICLYGLGYREATPVDTHLWQRATAWYFPELVGTALTPGRYERVCAELRTRFGNDAGLAHLMMYFDRLETWRDEAKALRSARP